MKRMFLLSVVSAIFTFFQSCGNKSVDASVQKAGMELANNAQSVFEFTVEDIDGKKVSLETYKGKTLLFVNVASKCGYTGQYEDLQKLYDQYKGKGLVILGFPANNFLGQEPGTNAEIKQFCSKNYGVSFPMFAKISVKGDDIHPLYRYLTTQTKENVSWNFNKYLVNKEGKVVAHFGSKTAPLDDKLVQAIEKLL